MSLEKHNHKQGRGPGSEWRGLKESQILHKEHTTTVGDLLSEKHFDVFVRYGFAKALVEGAARADLNFWKEMYTQMQERRIGLAKIKKFKSLIKKIEKSSENLTKNGIESIPVDKDYEILDGSHRLACFAVFNLKPSVTIFDTQSHSYDKSWFQTNGFASEQLDTVEKEKKVLIAKYQEKPENARVSIIWGVALNHWEIILSMIGSTKIRRAFIRDFGSSIEKFIIHSYEGDGMPVERISEKSKQLSERSSKVGLLAIDLSEDEMKTTKRQIREKISPYIVDYFFDCIIHVVDNPETGEALWEQHKIR